MATTYGLTAKRARAQRMTGEVGDRDAFRRINSGMLLPSIDSIKLNLTATSSHRLDPLSSLHLLLHQAPCITSFSGTGLEHPLQRSSIIQPSRVRSLVLSKRSSV